jgi:hypothetical protein
MPLSTIFQLYSGSDFIGGGNQGGGSCEEHYSIIPPPKNEFSI